MSVNTKLTDGPYPLQLCDVFSLMCAKGNRLSISSASTRQKEHADTSNHAACINKEKLSVDCIVNVQYLIEFETQTVLSRFHVKHVRRQCGKYTATLIFCTSYSQSL